MCSASIGTYQLVGPPFCMSIRNRFTSIEAVWLEQMWKVCK